MKKKKTDVEISRVCAFCEKSDPLCDEQFVLCHKNGIVKADFACRKFSYDPLRRKPHSDPKVELVSLEDL